MGFSFLAIWYLTGVITCILTTKFYDKQTLTVGRLLQSLAFGVLGFALLLIFLITWLVENSDKEIW